MSESNTTLEMLRLLNLLRDQFGSNSGGFAAFVQSTATIEAIAAGLSKEQWRALCDDNYDQCLAAAPQKYKDQVARLEAARAGTGKGAAS